MILPLTHAIGFVFAADFCAGRNPKMLDAGPHRALVVLARDHHAAAPVCARADAGTVRQSAELARLPLVASSSFSALKVPGEKNPRLRQFDTACIDRPVSVATAAVPPSASMTSDVVARGSIPLQYTQTVYMTRGTNR